jgi:sugar lactone lactonase YvrE
MKILLVAAALLLARPAFANDVAQNALKHLPDRTTAPTHRSGEVEAVQKFAFPPGHVTISRTGRFFMDAFTYDNQSKFRVVELKNGKMTPFPSVELQKQFKTVHGLFVDARDRLWILDHGGWGFSRAPHLFGFDINTGKQIVSYAFPRDVAGPGSMLNDVLLDVRRDVLLLSDTGPINNKSAILVYDIRTNTSRRVLSQHPSLTSTDNTIFVEGKPFTVLGLIHPHYGLDGIAIDDEYFYYSAFNRGELYKIPLAKLTDARLGDRELARSIEKVADITMSDGMWADEQGRVWLTDVEHSAITRVNRDGSLETVYKDPRFRWPAGFARAPDGTFYFNCDAIDQTQLVSRDTILKRGPYYQFRFKPKD